MAFLRTWAAPLFAVAATAAASCGSGDAPASTSASTGVTSITSGTGGGAGGASSNAPVPVLTCKSTLPAPESGVCTVAKGSAVEVIRGRVVGPGNIFEGGEVVVDANGIIACVDCDCSTTAGYQGATIVSCPGGVVSPALINAHDHLTYAQNGPKPHAVMYDHVNEWRDGLDGKPQLVIPAGSPEAEVVEWGELRFVMGGAASTVGGGGEPGMLRNLDVGGALDEGLDLPAVDFQTFPLQDQDGAMLTTCTYPSTADSDAEVDGDAAYLPHIAEGVILQARNEFTCTDGAPGSQRDYLEKQTALIQAIGLQVSDVALMAAGQTSLVWSPRSNIGLYGFTANVTEFATEGVDIALGTDWSATGSMNLLRELACASSFNQTYLNGFFSSYDLYRMVTEEAALVTATETKLGQLTPGFFGDITVWGGATGDVHDLIVGAGVGDVALVLRGGLVLYGEAPLVDALSPDGGAGCEAIAVCGSSNKLCAEREFKADTATLAAGILAGSGEVYPLFFCSTPMDEPTCVPARPGEFTGIPTATDRDGDGIPDATDLCPTIFSAIRPMDNGVQPDANGNGIGDACDPDPLSTTSICNGEGEGE
jgi:large repetitive protein